MYGLGFIRLSFYNKEGNYVFLLGIDVGTSGTKTVLFDENGNALASALAEYPLYQPENGWVEHEPEDGGKPRAIP